VEGLLYQLLPIDDATVAKVELESKAWTFNVTLLQSTIDGRAVQNVLVLNDDVVWLDVEVKLLTNT
jgi:hypothetical protein